MRRELVVLPVSGDERHASSADRSHRDRGRRLPVWRVDYDLFGIVEKRVEPGTAEDADLGRRHDPDPSFDGVAAPEDGSFFVLVSPVVFSGELSEEPASFFVSAFVPAVASFLSSRPFDPLP